MRPDKHSVPDWNRAISLKLKGAERLFVLGVGNPRKGDDAAGSLCARRLNRELRPRRRPAQPGSAGPRGFGRKPRKTQSLEILALDAGGAPENATGPIRKFGPTHVLIVDAALGGFEPGTIFLVDRKKIAQEDVSTHRIPLVHLIRYLEESMGCRVTLVGIEPKDLAPGAPVSPSVKSAAARLAAWLAGL